MADDNDESKNSHNNSNNSRNSNNTNPNPFIRFKHHVDTNIHAGLHTLTGLSRSHGAERETATDRDADSTNNTHSLPPSPRTPSNNSHPPNKPTNMTPTPTSNTPSPTPTPPATTTTPNPPSLTFLTPQDAHLESHLTTLTTTNNNATTATTAPEAHRIWSLFLARSAYSPLRLEHDPSLVNSWRPTPQDVPHGWEESGAEVGWLEAFEDLMRVESGLGLTDLGYLAERARRPAGVFGGGLLGDFPGAGIPSGGGLFGGFPGGLHHPNQGMAVGFGGGMGGMGMGMREAAWLGRMRRDRLGEVLFPVCDPRLGYQSPRTMEEWVERRRVERERVMEAGRLVEELVTKGERAIEDADAWAEEAAREVKRKMDAWEGAGRDTTTSFFDGLGGIVRTLGKVLEDEGRSLQKFGKADENNGERKEATADKTDAHTATPETENDLYSVIQSAFHESERSLSNFFKSMSEGRRSDRELEPKPASPPKTEITETIEDGVTKTTAKKEFVDKHGNTHTKTETTWTDENGQVVMRQVHSSMGRSDHWEKTFQYGSASQDKDTTAEKPEQPEQQKREGGWFWK